MNNKQRERWGGVRAKGRARFVLYNVIAAALCGVLGHALVWVSVYAWRGESTPYSFWGLIVMVVALAFAGYYQASRAWRKNEREYLALAEAGRGDPAVTRTSAI